jgi:hypothetical protein
MDHLEVELWSRGWGGRKEAGREIPPGLDRVVVLEARGEQM